MSTTIQVERLAESGFAAAAGALARAFLDDDPMFNIFEPDRARRAVTLPVFMAWGCRYCHRFGESYTTADPIRGAAWWIPPDSDDITPDRLDATGFGQVVEAWGEGAIGRFGTVNAHLEALHHRNLPQAHWYLIGMGVDPPYQGQGIGGALMQPVLRKADAAGLPCYLETQKSRNVPFYRRDGFEVVAETDAPDGGPHFWHMVRPPLTVQG